ncbi:MAG: UDP-N-acetylglucosamine 1-carboxyvinyltransferase [Deltaproteobacteria bacterium]|nr:UDP-N-acetylglucosamine 1-carboxyvinyltransferase [Deltaproteobacteria bacterium]
MDKIIIKGGKSLKGEVKISGAKNAALPILISSLLTDGTCKYNNVPALNDIKSVNFLLENLGAKVVKTGAGSLSINSENFNNHKTSYELVRKMRASILVLGPLLARLKKAEVSFPGGCAIGARPVDLHLKGLAALGAKIEIKNGYIKAFCSQLKGADIYFDFPTVTGAENLMMAASLAKGTTVLKNCAKEPEVIELADVLNKMGAKIKGAGTPTIEIIGVKELKPAEVAIMPDRIEVGTFIIAAALTNGDILIKGCAPKHLEAVINKLKEAGADIIVKNNNIRAIGNKEIKSADIKTLPYPGFPTDMQAQFMVLMCFGNGVSMIEESVFENRLIHVSELNRMGADIKVSGNKAMVKGVKFLSGAPVMASDLRASASLVLAGLAAKGVTEINRIYHLDRGYENIEAKFSALGADIKRISV